MIRKLVVIFLIVGLALAFAAPASLTAQPLGDPGKTTPNDLPVMQLPDGLLTGGQSSPTAPGGVPGPPEWAGGGDENGNGQAANKWAVVIGIADYQGTEADLWHPDEDAKEMARALSKDYGFPTGNVKVLLNREATAEAILSAIYWLELNEDGNSTVVFFFSGHGYRAVDDYVFPDGTVGWDADVELDGYDEGIVSWDMYGLIDGDLKDRFSAFETQKFALIFGSCHSGGMFDDPSVDLRTEGRVISSACKAGQYGWDYFTLGNTLFGYYFVDRGILKGRADLNGDGVSMEEALAYASPLVAAEQPDSEPQIYDGYTGELIP